MDKFNTEFYSDGFFEVNKINGFLPCKEPLELLPVQYDEINKVILNLKYYIDNNDDIILNNYYDTIIFEGDIYVIQALFRAYSFIIAVYCLRPTYRQLLDNGIYGKANNIVPKYLAQPYIWLSNKLEISPWLDYHYAYSLGNYVRKNKDDTSLDWRNLKMACSFSGSDDEIGFIMVHVYINELSKYIIESIEMISNGNIEEGLLLNYKTMIEINKRRKEMWIASNHKNYNTFRPFIMGVKGNNDIFGNGVVFEGEFNNEPQQPRGQTGAQDDIIPTEDIITGLINYYPDNMLTQYLYDLRKYRPKCIQRFFDDLQKNFKLEYNRMRYDDLVLLLGIIDQIYIFRNGHWQFVQKYIMENTKYNIATGGTPITSWLPNQIEACLKAEIDIINIIENNYSDNYRDKYDIYKHIYLSLPNKIFLLNEQIKNLSKIGCNIKSFYDLNDKYNLNDK